MRMIARLYIPTSKPNKNRGLLEVQTALFWLQVVAASVREQKSRRPSFIFVPFIILWQGLIQHRHTHTEIEEEVKVHKKPNHTETHTRINIQKYSYSMHAISSIQYIMHYSSLVDATILLLIFTS
jgi:hypothetical protein